MNIKNIPFQIIDWTKVPKTEHKGDPGVAYWHTLQFDGLRIRIVEYSKGYIADHWCKKGHIVHSLEGNSISELITGEKHPLNQGMTYVVSDDLSSHRSVTKTRLKAMIIDGDLLKLKPEESKNIPFQTIDWTKVPKTEHKGETGVAYGQTIQFDGLRIRIVEYSKGYIADHWCEKGHIVHCLEGEFVNELIDGGKHKLTKGMSFVVSDELSSHRVVTEKNVKLLIVDGDFLKLKS